MSGTSAPAPSALNLPNALTVVRILLVPVFAWLFLSHPEDATWRIWALVVFLVAVATDHLDGRIARARNLITDFGKLFDPIADKALTGMAFIALSVVGELWWWVTILVLVREWGITVLRFAMLKYGVIAANRGGKTKTVFQAVALSLFLLPPVPWITWVAVVVMGIAVVLTVLTGLDYVREAILLRRRTLAANS